MILPLPSSDSHPFRFFAFSTISVLILAFISYTNNGFFSSAGILSLCISSMSIVLLINTLDWSLLCKHTSFIDFSLVFPLIPFTIRFSSDLSFYCSTRTDWSATWFIKSAISLLTLKYICSASQLYIPYWYLLSLPLFQYPFYQYTYSIGKKFL